jgi:hypothetical protein
MDWSHSMDPTEVQLAATETLVPAEAHMESTEVQLAATETLVLLPAEARMESTEVQLGATEPLCSKRRTWQLHRRHQYLQEHCQQTQRAKERH